jgi:pyruvate/2-oxoglutarate dehydrogenase complex dihydrolipoamide acyltransferase (E2) component
MSRFKSPPAVCPACGTANPADARFCVRCAARLGAEPSIVAPRLSAPSRPADAGAIPSRPAPLSSGRTDTTAFWVKLGLGGLLLLIGFVCWSVYILTDVKTVPQMPTGQGGGTAGVVLAPVIATPVPAPAPTASTPAAAAEPPSTTIPSTTVPAASTAAAPASNTVAPVTAASAASRARAASRQAARAAEERAAEDRAVVNGGWVEPSRPPAMTSSPSYQDAGPPIVRGPEPRETAPVPVTAPNPVVVQPQPRVETAPDLGPPVIEGPGPRYDFSRPGSGGGR